MKNDLTTGTWQDDIWCPINIILLCTSDVDNSHTAASLGCELVVKILELFVACNFKEPSALNSSSLYTLINSKRRIYHMHATSHSDAWRVIEEGVAEHQYVTKLLCLLKSKHYVFRRYFIVPVLEISLYNTNLWCCVTCRSHPRCYDSDSCLYSNSILNWAKKFDESCFQVLVKVINLCSALPMFKGRQSGVVPGGRSSGWTLLAGTTWEENQAV